MRDVTDQVVRRQHSGGLGEVCFCIDVQRVACARDLDDEVRAGTHQGPGPSSPVVGTRSHTARASLTGFRRSPS